MSIQQDKLLNLITSSKRILITSHVSPDPDAIGSTLLLHELIKRNATAEVEMCIEGPILPLFRHFTPFQDLHNKPLTQCIQSYKPDLLIILDADKFSRVTQSQDESLYLQELIKQHNIQTLVIDHHTPSNEFTPTLYINPPSSSTCETVYTLFLHERGWKLPTYSQPQKSVLGATLLGILADTGTFRFANPNLKNTFKVVDELVSEDISIEFLTGMLQTYTPDHIRVMGELMNNLTQTDQYNYTYISDEFFGKYCLSMSDPTASSFATKAFTDVHTFLTHVAPHTWGFVIAPSSTEPHAYKGSFRAQTGTIDTTIFTSKMNGGGHRYASGFKISAQSDQEAIEHVKRIIAQNTPPILKKTDTT